MEHKSGFVNIIGSPNVGKSTLMNALMGEKLSIITYKAQTTRHRIMGLANGEDFQIVFSDTPGIVDPAYRLHEGMMRMIETALQDADVFLIVVEIGQTAFKNNDILHYLQNTDVPTILCVNKIDLSEQTKVAESIAHWTEVLPKAQVLPISALHQFHTNEILEIVKEKLPENPPYFPKDELSDKPMRFFISEIIREKIFLHFEKEVPYSCEVEIEAYKDEEEIVRISALIYTERESQKAIIIGKGGGKLKKVATEARIDMEAFIGKKVFLEVFVKVQKDWRSNERQLKRFGYLN